MKKRIFIGFLSLLIINIPLSHAQSIDKSKLLPVEPSFIFTDPTTQPETGSPHLPSGDFLQDILPAVIKILLGLSASLTLIALTAGAVILVTAQGNEDQINKGKRILMWTVLALILISLSYGIIYGIAKLKFD